MPKILITLTILFLTLSAVFGVLNTNKSRNLRELAAQNDTARAQAEQARITKERELRTKEAEAAVKAADTEAKIASAEADLVKSQTERAELHTQLAASQEQLADLQRRLEEATVSKPELLPDALPMPGGGDLAQELEQTRKQLETAEREKQLLAGQIRGNQERSTGAGGAQRRRAVQNPGLRGTVLAVNQAYNFVVLNLGGRQGVEPNSEMLVLRGGTMIGKIRVSSVEPATAIGDIVGSSLARGVQVQPGDTVIYAGS
ncbi:MAG: hypothetical protein H0T11_06805 [Chthoniobacterales bacterium]|nr:hypothetical protein [Chthoniobacterales bacterium]